ncbi:MAG: hypothetical protein AAB443_04605 [Patescibacteria group bacterium]
MQSLLTKKTFPKLLLVSLFALLFTKAQVKAQLDTTAPTSSITLNPTSPDGDNGWYVSPVDITITSDDLDSGVSSINWSIDGGPTQSQVFNNTLNQVQNPSFETAGAPLDLWEKTNDDGIALFTQDPTFAPGFDSNSAKIESTVTGWHAFNNQTNYIVTSPYQNMTSSIWVKTDTAIGNANYKVYLIYDNGLGGTATQLLATSSSVTGSADWQKLTLNFSTNNSATLGVYLDLGLDGIGTVWYDGVSVSSSLTNPSTNFAISQNGSHTLSYWALDNANNEELPHKTSSFKIDTKAPSRWTNFTLTEAGNNHTFIVSIKVSDTTSGLDVSTAEFQYSVDQGVTWGYYTPLSSCSGSFNSGWTNPSVSPSSDGSTTVTLTTAAIDFCNSNWTATKEIRFRIKDMAGNLSQSPDFTINGAWVRVAGGGAYSNYNIAMLSASEGGYLAGAKEGVSNITTTNNWYLEDYEILSFDNYSAWYSKYPTTTSLPSGKLPTVSGKYRVNSDFTIASSTIPNGLSTTQNLSSVVFVNGDLNINTNYSLHATSGIIFIVSGDISVSSSTSSIDGFFITDGQFDGGTGTTALTVTGGVQADSFNLKRSLNGSQNSSNPAITFNYVAKYLVVGKNQLTANFGVKWLEVE